MVSSVAEEPRHSAIQKDKRRNLRVPLLVVRAPCDDGRATFFGYARNLSRGGVFIPTVNPRRPGEQFLLRMTLPTAGGCEVVCRCEVVWQRCFERESRFEPGMGLRFLDLSEDVAEALERWLTALDPRS